MSARQRQGCVIDGCGEFRHGRERCRKHYWELTYVHRPRPPRPRRDVAERFWEKVDKSGECWLWMGHRSKDGYGVFNAESRKPSWAHRVAYELAVGAIPAGLTIDHLCRNPPCVNPTHLEPVTMRENTLRGFSISAINAKKTHCIRGHEFTEANTYRYWKGRACRQCARLRDVARRAAG